MPRTDHEAVLRELAAHIASKPQHGQRELLRLIAQLTAAHVVPESLIERASRIYGLPRLVHAIPAAEAAAEPDAVRAGIASDPGPPMEPEEVHDGSESNGRRAGHAQGHPDA